MTRDVHVRTVATRSRWFAYILTRSRPRDRRDILERTPERSTLLEANAEAELMAHARGWRIKSVRLLPAGAFSQPAAVGRVRR